MNKLWRLLLVAPFALGCNDSKTVRSPDSESPSTENAPAAEKPAASDSGASSKASSPTEPEPAESTDDSGFDPDMARIVLERGRKQAVQCPNVAKNTPTGEGEIEVHFDGQSGKIFEVNLGTTFTAGSNDGQACLRNAFLGQIVTPFKGKKKLSYALNVPAAAPAADKDAKGKSK
ncbi:MAG: hypothetical protein FJ096_13230 [Deltaproteobacteria bacterium]|nr:hypothetical protein [Deltaproteobacteria bacterium]